jgi:hypothetical protein
MINIFFVPGMFGSTIEYAIQNYSEEYTPDRHAILDDGSMHSFSKKFHPTTLEAVADFCNNSLNIISTPIYPFTDANLSKIVKAFSEFSKVDDKFILLYAKSQEYAELNILFQYRKIATGSLNMGVGAIMAGGVNDLAHWGNGSKSWEDREWFSIFYPVWINEWTTGVNDVTDSWLTISNSDMLNDTHGSLVKIIKYCGLTLTIGLQEFATKWRAKQQYIIDELELANAIVASVKNNDPMEWDTNSLCIVSEAIIQNKLRRLGYEIKCYGLDKFPNSSVELLKLLDNYQQPVV